MLHQRQFVTVVKNLSIFWTLEFCNGISLYSLSFLFFLKIARGKILFFCIILSGKILSFWWCGFYEAKLGAMFISVFFLSCLCGKYVWEHFLLYFTFPLVSYFDFPLLLLTIFPIPKSVIQNLNIVMKCADLQFFLVL